VDAEKSNTSLKILRYTAVGVAVLAAGALVLSLIVGEEDEEPVAAETESKTITRLPGKVQTEAVEVAVGDPTVKRLLGDHEVDERRAAPWVAEGGAELLGASVRIRLARPLRLDGEKLPAYITPDRDAPPSTPPMRRYVRYSGTGFTELRVLMELPSKEVLEIAPEGSAASITGLQLIGPPLSKDYRGSGGY
jgi:hypothetical protein